MPPSESKERYSEDHHDDRTGRSCLPKDEDHDPDGGERYTDNRCKHDEPSERCCYGFSALKPVVDRIGMANDRSEQRHIPEGRIDEPNSNRCSQHALARIADENKATQLLAKHTHDVGRAGVPGPDRANIDALTSCHEHTEADASKQVCEHDSEDLFHIGKCRSTRPGCRFDTGPLPIGSLNRYRGGVLWLSPPPYLRWFAAAAIIVAALAWDLSGRQSEPFPFAATPIPAGTQITDDLIEWKPLPEGSLPAPPLAGVTATAAIDAGDPLTRSVLSQTPKLPDGWWSIPIDIPNGLPVGAAIRVVLPDGSAASGIVTHPASSDGFGVPTPGSVGFPESIADTVARVASAGDVVILVEP